VQAGLHFVAFTPASSKFHAARNAMDGVLPDGTNLRTAPYNITDANNGLNGVIGASHPAELPHPAREPPLLPPHRTPITATTICLRDRQCNPAAAPG
jgi:hypothetical protein